MGYRLEAWHPACIKAGQWMYEDRFVGQGYSVSFKNEMLREFEREFNCKYVNYHTEVEFETETQYNWFLIKWGI